MMPMTHFNHILSMISICHPAENTVVLSNIKALL